MAEEKKKAAVPQKVAVKKTNEKLKFTQRVKKWFRDMKSELKKVVWPTPRQTAKNTVVAVVMIVVCAIVLWGFDKAAEELVRFLITNISL